MARKEMTSIRLSKDLVHFLNDCKHKTRSKSVEAMLRRVAGSIWETCVEMEKEHNSRLWKFDHEGSEDCYIYDKLHMKVKKIVDKKEAKYN